MEESPIKKKAVPRISVDTQVLNPAPQGYRAVAPSLDHVRFVFEVAVRLIAMLGDESGLESIRITFSQSAIQFFPHYKIRLAGGLGHVIEACFESDGIQRGFRDEEYAPSNPDWGRNVGKSAEAIYLAVMQAIEIREKELRIAAEALSDRRLNPKT